MTVSLEKSVLHDTYRTRELRKINPLSKLVRYKIKTTRVLFTETSRVISPTSASDEYDFVSRLIFSRKLVGKNF